MEEGAKEQLSASASAKRSATRLLRYPLRSAGKVKEEKPPLADSFNSSATRRVKPGPSVSKSISVLDLNHSKDKPAKPPRRMSNPSNSAGSPAASAQAGNITPISEAARSKRSNLGNNEGRSDTPTPSDVSRSLTRRKFSVISSASYWLTQIKLSESAAKHSISLGFFKLGLEAGCEPLQCMRDELRAYAQRHNLVELGESVKQLFESYKILPDFEQLQVSETCSHVLDEEVTRSSDDEIHSRSSPVAGAVASEKQLGSETGDKPPSSTTSQVAVVAVQAKDASRLKSETGTKKQQKPMKNEAGIGGRNNVQKKIQKMPIKKNEPTKGKVKVQQGKNSVVEEELIKDVPVPEKLLEENKENTDAALQMKEISCVEE
ncbi:unnamed protein product [Cuscuta epithymum]|uniref:Uncharacterized protein n=1 Tax=Cuscuta epithymum TaxID=186058 RepID=A0AAV0ESD3_9ASTE|nr:unnamed protein product [Cuscuta epithymum]